MKLVSITQNCWLTGSEKKGLINSHFKILTAILQMLSQIHSDWFIFVTGKRLLRIRMVLYMPAWLRFKERESGSELLEYQTQNLAWWVVYRQLFWYTQASTILKGYHKNLICMLKSVVSFCIKMFTHFVVSHKLATGYFACEF